MSKRMVLMFAAVSAALGGMVGCRSGQAVPPLPVREVVPQQHATTRAIDAVAAQLASAPADEQAKRELYAQRWLAVQRAVAHHGATHRDAFYGSRSYWHANSARGIRWALDQRRDLDDAFYIDGRGNILVHGDVNQDIEISDSSIVHILGDLNATLDLSGICEVIIAGELSQDATIICDGQLELFVGGNSAGILGSTKSSTLIIDGNAAGTLQSGAPATRLTVTGDLAAEIPPPAKKDTILTLRVDGYASTAAMLDLADAGFARVNATLGLSDAPAGVYPKDANAPRPKARWVVITQRDTGTFQAD